MTETRVTTGEELIATWPERHPRTSTCPACHSSVARVGIVELVYTFETCECDVADYVHLAERVWHHRCFAASVAGDAFLDQLGWEVHDAAGAVAGDNPYDGRTTPGRAWRDAVWELRRRIVAVLDTMRSGGASDGT